MLAGEWHSNYLYISGPARSRTMSASVESLPAIGWRPETGQNEETESRGQVRCRQRLASAYIDHAHRLEFADRDHPAER